MPMKGHSSLTGDEYSCFKRFIFGCFLRKQQCVMCDFIESDYILKLSFSKMIKSKRILVGIMYYQTL